MLPTSAHVSYRSSAVQRRCRCVVVFALRMGIVVVSNLLAENLIDLLGGLVLGDAVLLGDFLSETIFVARNGSEVFRGELVEVLSESVALAGKCVGHID